MLVAEPAKHLPLKLVARSVSKRFVDIKLLRLFPQVSFHFNKLFTGNFTLLGSPYSSAHFSVILLCILLFMSGLGSC